MVGETTINKQGVSLAFADHFSPGLSSLYYSRCPKLALAGSRVVGAFQLMGLVGTCLAVETATLILPSFGFLSVFFGLGRQ